MDLPPDALTVLRPCAGRRFTGLTRAQVAAEIAAIGPMPQVSKSDADRIDAIVHAEYLAGALAAWNRRHLPRVPDFVRLPSGWQTVLFSRTFHQGLGMPDSQVAQPFYKAASAGHWAEAVTALRSYGVAADWYKQRVAAEAALLAQQLPPPVPPAAGPPGAGPPTGGPPAAGPPGSKP
jgi:hypothetical protein